MSVWFCIGLALKIAFVAMLICLSVWHFIMYYSVSSGFLFEYQLNLTNTILICIKVLIYCYLHECLTLYFKFYSIV